MAGNTPAQPQAVWPGDELRGDFRTSRDRTKTALDVWFSGWRQAENQIEAEAL
jgi:hypothetical protein